MDENILTINGIESLTAATDYIVVDPLIIAANEVLQNIMNRGFGLSIEEPKIEKVTVFLRGNFTAVLINDKAIGFSKRNNCDKYNKYTGIRKALYNAVQDLIYLSLESL